MPSARDTDFLPFGQEVNYTTACGQNYKFEGKERDIETGNDNFGARYYSSRLGRWLSADWSSVPAPVPYANLTNPQTLNLYAMVSDNPETFADLDGHDGLGDNDRNPTPKPANDTTPPPQGEGHTGTGTGTSTTQQAQAWSLTWQLKASGNFLLSEVKGVYDTTAAPLVSALEHPVKTAENAASNLVEGVKDVAKDPKGTLSGAAEGAKDVTVQFGSKVASGDPRAIGQAAGLVIDAYVAVR